MSQEHVSNSPEQSDLILTADGKPFQSRGGAQSALKQKKLESTHELVDYGDGFAIIAKESAGSKTESEKTPEPEPVKEKASESPAGTGKSAEVANSAKKPKSVSKPVGKSLEDMSEDEIREVLKRKAEERVEKEDADSDAGEESYYLVCFQERSAAIQPNDVQLSVNGKVLILQRGVNTIVPKRYLNSADTATYPHYEQKPGVGRKITHWIKKFPYTVLHRVSKREYEEFLSAGNKTVQENYQKYGMERPPEIV